MAAEDLPSAPKKKFAVALDMMHEIRRDMRHEVERDTGEKPGEPHGMAAAVHAGSKSRPERERVRSETSAWPCMVPRRWSSRTAALPFDANTQTLARTIMALPAS